MAQRLPGLPSPVPCAMFPGLPPLNPKTLHPVPCFQAPAGPEEVAEHLAGFHQRAARLEQVCRIHTFEL
jgi:hypothetical protein